MIKTLCFLAIQVFNFFPRALIKAGPWQQIELANISGRLKSKDPDDKLLLVMWEKDKWYAYPFILSSTLKA